MDVTRIETLSKLCKHFLKAHSDSLAWAGRRADLPPGTSRAKITTANAKWAQSAEGRDRIYAQILKEASALSKDCAMKEPQP